MKFIVTNETRDENLPWLFGQLNSQLWGSHYTEARVREAVKHSLNFWLHDVEYPHRYPVGYARVLTDRAITSTLNDVFVVNSYQKQGAGRALMEAVVAHPDVCNTNCVLGTMFADRFYRKFGFEHIVNGAGDADFQMMIRYRDRV